MADKKPSRIKNLGLAAVAAQAGCATLVIVFGALLIGLWLDARTGQRGVFAILLLVLSVPVSLAVMLYISLGAIRRIVPQVTEAAQDSAPTDMEED
ncbi:MAG: hypothetical protein CL610_02135 [Anaerolineaceae bacterium]|nr:hypothetical protein [Anaerolineaceae bacterium]